MVARNLFLLFLNCFPWPCLGTAWYSLSCKHYSWAQFVKPCALSRKISFSALLRLSEIDFAHHVTLHACNYVGLRIFDIMSVCNTCTYCIYYRTWLKGGSQVVWMLQAKPNRSSKQEQQQNRPNLPSPLQYVEEQLCASEVTLYAGTHNSKSKIFMKNSIPCVSERIWKGCVNVSTAIRSRWTQLFPTLSEMVTHISSIPLSNGIPRPIRIVFHSPRIARFTPPPLSSSWNMGTVENAFKQVWRAMQKQQLRIP